MIPTVTMVEMTTQVEPVVTVRTGKEVIVAKDEIGIMLTDSITTK